MNKNLLLTFIFILILLIMFWLMPNIKIDNIGNFLEKTITPLAYPLSAMLVTKLGYTKYKEFKDKKGNET